MAHDMYDPMTSPAPDKLGPRYGCMEPCCMGATPGGRTTNVGWDEKGVLDRYVMHVAGNPRPESLPSAHDSFKQGIYTSNSVGDYD